jgi:methionyl-tRNA synthetase
MEYLALMPPRDKYMSDNAHFGSVVGLVLIFVLIWSIVWKGIALWKAARNGQKVWFIVLFILNTVGLLELIYVLIVAKRSQQPKVNPPLQQA